MGNCESRELVAQAKQNKIINTELDKAKKTDENIIKLLLLGAGESGKSTVLKQMKIIHNSGFSQEEISNKRNVVCANTVQAMGALLDGMKQLQFDFSTRVCNAHEKLIRETLNDKAEYGPFSDAMFNALTELWADKGVQCAYDKREFFYLHDSAKYFLDRIARVHTPNYVPTENDILHTRVPTMGVIEVNFTIKGKFFRVFDVGGQRSQRKKWIHCFDDAKAMIYVASLSEYDQVLLEDNTTNRMHESIQLFKQVINNKYFVNTSVILFLNKIDLFEEKIVTKKRSLGIAFESFSGPSQDLNAAVAFVEKKYRSMAENKEKNIYCHHTCATDTQQVQYVLDAVLDTILSTKLKGCGLY
nr:G protein alpha subunit [Caenorhabditis elegans]